MDSEHMEGRPAKRPREQAEDTEEPSYHPMLDSNDPGESSEDWQPQTPQSNHITSSASSMARPQRATGGLSSASAVTVSRSPSSPPEEMKRSIRLTVKMPSSKLREVTSSADTRPHNIFTEPVVITGPRSSRSKKKIVEVDSEDEEEVDSTMEDEGANDEMELSDDPDADAEADEDLDAEGEPDMDLDAEGEIDMDDAPPVAPISRPAISVSTAAATKVMNAEARTMDLEEEEDDDEELSELESEPEEEKGDDTVLQEEVDGEVEEEEEEDGEEVEEDEDEEDETATPAEASRASTPGYTSRMTKRQRERLQFGDFLQLPMEPQVKKHLTAEEHAMRRAEMARRRKNLSEKRNEEEKMDTINKLLKKQAPKRRGKISAAETAGDASPRVQEVEEVYQPEPTMLRYISNADGCRLGIPEEWAGTPAGRLFESQANGLGNKGTGRLVTEIA